MEDSLSKIEPTSFDKELVEKFESIHGFKIDSPDFYFSLIEEKLSVIGSIVTGGQLLCRKGETESINSWLELIIENIKIYVDTKYNSPSHEVVIIGDNMINYAYIIPEFLFVENFWDFFSIPQDTYVVIKSKHICLQYTYEDELYVHGI